ncbi:hypothetical protein M3A49_16635 [Paraburkholderia sp. CNPSo 3076]|uniref:hypothetical protein n=1 Tax=Paraburkholderia sp. CNPSo 3076 TaxID=2940936 RepID=UPI002253DE85|nr:hypothetical protein [Paraburkholderia sp. CNPSo 3076]MCX5541106.1 hypothetical protein [Paraburkholderia sp. CNPSo 3076]
MSRPMTVGATIGNDIDIESKRAGSMSAYRAQGGIRLYSPESHSIHSPPSRGEMHAATASSAKSKIEDASTANPVPHAALINEAANAELLT